MAKPCVRCGEEPPTLYTLSPRDDWTDYLGIDSNVMFVLCELCYEEAELLAQAETTITSGEDDLLVERSKSFLDDVGTSDLITTRKQEQQEVFHQET